MAVPLLSSYETRKYLNTVLCYQSFIYSPTDVLVSCLTKQY